jgi:hypothetical protein
MKKLVFCIIPLAMAIMGCASNGSAAAKTNDGSPGMDLDAAIREAATQMEENLPGMTEVALVSVASSSAQFSEYVISRLEAALVSGRKLIVVDRANLDRVREEQGFQLSGEVDDNSAKAIGKLLGAGAIVTGAFVNLGDVYSLTLKAINIETATVAVSYPADIARSTRIETLLASGGGGAAGTQTTQRGTADGRTTAQPSAAPTVVASVPAAPVAAPAPVTPPAPVYRIGDTGPAGGIIFYDKGNSTNGWRYLEAALEDVGPAVWATEGLSDQSVNNLTREMGKGKSNTMAIMALAKTRGGGFGWAVWFCDTYEVNGFDDWFLPSQDELNYMYGNLYMRNLGNFSAEWYWSSSIYMPYNQAFVQAMHFTDGRTLGHSNSNLAPNLSTSGPKYRIRPVRQF